MDVANHQFLVANLRWATSVVALAGCEAGSAAEPRLRALRDEALAELARVRHDDVPYVRLVRKAELTALEGQIVALALAWAIDPERSRLLGALPRRVVTGELVLGDVARLFADDEPAARLQLLALGSERSRLRALRLIEPIGAGRLPLLAAPLRLTAAALRYLLADGQDGAYHRLTLGAAGARPARAVLPEAQRRTVTDALLAAAAAFQAGVADVQRDRRAILLLLVGAHGTGKALFARELAGRFFPGLIEVDGAALVHDPDPARALTDAFDAAILHSAAVLVTGGEALFTRHPAARALILAARECPTCVFVTTTERALAPALEPEWFLVVELAEVAEDQSEELWRAHLPPGLDAEVDVAAVGERFPIGGVAVGRATRLALAQSHAPGGPGITTDSLEQAADLQLGAGMGALVRVVRPRYPLDALILPDDELGQIRDIIDAYQSWHHVMGRWGLGDKLHSGKCISCLFYGAPGTGKTFAAEVIASAIGKALHIVSLPNILSKWFGETERNIHDLFERSRLSNAVMLLDEADALFATRVEVQSAQDHAMNMTTGLLLQEIERHTGLVIMTTNLSENIDSAFQRRILFNIEFVKPDPDARHRIWRRLLPPQMPVRADVDLRAIATRFDLSGGEIKNAVLRASFRAWAERGAVSADHLIEACEHEYRNTGRVLVSQRRR